MTPCDEKAHDNENLEFVAFSRLGKYPNRVACINHSAGKALTLTLGDLITKRGAKIWDEWDPRSDATILSTPHAFGKPHHGV